MASWTCTEAKQPSVGRVEESLMEGAHNNTWVLPPFPKYSKNFYLLPLFLYIPCFISPKREIMKKSWEQNTTKVSSLEGPFKEATGSLTITKTIWTL